MTTHTAPPTQNTELVTQNEEIPLLRDSLEESKYLESKVVSWREREKKIRKLERKKRKKRKSYMFIIIFVKIEKL